VSFLLPAAWWLGGLALPIIALYLLKTRQRRRNVSTLLFWEALKPKMENSPLWRKLRRWLSLLLQLVILLLLLTALARPAFDWEKSAPRRVVAILDPSASMQAESPARWKNAVAALRSAIARMRVQDEMAILTAEDPPNILSGWTSHKRLLEGSLDAAAPVPTGTDPGPVLDLASDLTTLRENPVIEVYSDSVWPPGSRDSPVPNVRVIGVDPAPATNAGLTLFAVRRSPVAPGDWQLDAEIISTKPFSGTMELLRDGHPMDLVPVECSPENSFKKSWRGSSEAGAKFEARLKPAADDILASDNSAACELAPLATIDVLIAGKPDPFLEAALASIPLVNWWREENFPGNPMAGTDLIIATGGAMPESAGKIPMLLINPQRSGFWGQIGGKLTNAPVSTISRTSPLVRHAGLGSVVVGQAAQWDPAPGSEVVAASPESPLLFGHWDRDPRWLVIGFDPSESDLPLRTAFPIFMGNLLQSLRDQDDLKNAAAVLPGVSESRMLPLVKPSDPSPSGEHSGISVPGWWLVVLAGLLVLLAEWYGFNRRFTD
jgi:hypothetical protein